MPVEVVEQPEVVDEISQEHQDHGHLACEGLTRQGLSGAGGKAEVGNGLEVADVTHTAPLPDPPHHKPG